MMMRYLNRITQGLILVTTAVIGTFAAPTLDINDRRIASVVVSDLWVDGGVDPNAIDVEVHQGIVSLTGTVEDLLARRERRAAEKNAWDGGAKGVRNELDVSCRPPDI